MPELFEYAPAPESRSVVDIKSSYGLFINGEFTDGGGKAFKTISPSTEEVLAEVAEASDADVDTAVKAARRAHTRVWSRMSGAERGKYLFRIARIIQERAREIAVLESIDNGKPIKESRDVDIPTAAAYFFYYAGWADKLEHAGFGPDPRSLGVAGQVIPWNFPFLMLAWKIAPALATGNTVVLKPAETTPLTALLFAEICQQADLPPGVVNIITGAGATGQALVSHGDVDKVAFTGSTAVGRAIAKAVAGTEKKVTLELGGKAANIVFDDAPIDQAVEGIVNGIFFNQGHVCCAGSRLLVQESVADEVLERLKRRMSTLRLGDPLDKNTDVGAINSAAQLAKIRELSDVGEAEGAQRWAPACDLPEHGFWFPPTIFTGVSQAHRIAREEVFGPVLSVLTFRTPKEAVEKANNTPFGLSAGVWTDKGSRILWMASQLRAGVIWSNTFNKFDPASPFGGYKESGYGREGGRHGLEGYLSLHQHRRWSRQMTPPTERLDVRKTYKLYIGGAFPRSESGRSYVVNDAKGKFLANAAHASRKDGRDAVVAARAAFGGWSGRTAYNRGQVVYRIAEVMEDRRDQFEAELRTTEGVSAAKARTYVDAAIDRLVWYAGWADKIAQVTGGANPVAGPYFNHTAPEPSGVIAVVAPSGPLLGLISVVAPVIVAGNTCVVIASEPHPLTAITVAEVMATSDLPGGVVNILTGPQAEIAPWLAAHMDVNGIDLTGVRDADLARDLEIAAAENLKRVRRPGPEDLLATPALSRMTTFMETKTVWHPMGI